MRIYMIGIGGIGMSALAQLYLSQGNRISGSDKEPGPPTRLLEKKGVLINYGQKTPMVPVETDLVVYSDAVSDTNAERLEAKKLGKKQLSYFEALGEESRQMRTIAVSGTHGKTTTAAMLTKILKDAGKNPTAIIGSLVKDFGGNFVQGDPKLLVVEACEYRDHLLKLSPEILVITNIEWDHTDWFKSEEAVRATFKKAATKLPPHGKLIDKSVYGREPEYEIGLIGSFNQQNAKAAASAARVAFPDVSEASIRASLKSFKGSWRRFEYKGQTQSGVRVYDDYAHHPTAVASTLAGARAKFPNQKITLAFHPHLYSRTLDLFDGFVETLAKADEIILAPIYAARETNDRGVSSEKLAEAIAKRNKNVVALPNLEAVRDNLAEVKSGLIVTMGAGDIYKVADNITSQKL